MVTLLRWRIMLFYLSARLEKPRFDIRSTPLLWQSPWKTNPEVRCTSIRALYQLTMDTTSLADQTIPQARCFIGILAGCNDIFLPSFHCWRPILTPIDESNVITPRRLMCSGVLITGQSGFGFLTPHHSHAALKIAFPALMRTPTLRSQRAWRVDYWE